MQAKVPFALAMATMLALALTGCALPRGGPTGAEISAESSIPEGVAVEIVTRASAKEISAWPKVAQYVRYRWPAREAGPMSRTIQVGDEIELMIWDNQENSLLLSTDQRSVPLQPVSVASDGTIFVPYVDSIEVRGLSSSQARELIQAKLSTIAPSAQVQISVTGGVRNSVDLVSGVESPQTYELPDRNTSILSAIANGGGFSETLVNPVVRLSRGSQIYSIPAKALTKDPNKNVILRGGDQIIVEEDERFFVAMGATNSKTQIFFHQEKITALEAVSLAGGVDAGRANPEALVLLREYPLDALRPDRTGPSEQYVMFIFDLTHSDSLFGAQNFEMQPGDVVIASESAIKPAQAVIALLGSAFAITNVFE